MKNVLIIDNYDSFTYNLVHAIESAGADVTVWRNDEFELEEIQAFEKILLSPGPGIPTEAGMLLDVVREYAKTKSILGVCLGQQAIAEAFGGSLVNLEAVHHGVSAKVRIVDPLENLFDGFGPEIEVGRYHSWVVNPELPDVLIATSVDENGQIMSLRHAFLDVKGVQFHPESVLTPNGSALLKNWLES